MVLPDFTTQTATEYKTNIDESIADLTAGEGASYRESLVTLIHPDQSKGLQEIQKAGGYPVSFNQQWGGMGYGGLPDGTLGEVATGYSLIGNTLASIGQATSSNEKQANGFKVGKDTDVPYAFVLVLKAGNPTDNLTCEIWSDSSGPNAVITNGAATPIPLKTITDNGNGENVKFVFPTPPSLTAGAQYYLVLGRSGAFDATNTPKWKADSDSYTYPHGNFWTLNASWSENTTRQGAFLIGTSSGILGSGLTGFDGALNFYEGATLDQSGSFYFSNKELNHKRGLIHFAGTGWDADKTFYDSGLGSDNNRIVIRCNVTTGFAQVDLYENDETKHTVTGTTDISTGNHIVSVGYRAEGDGSDFLKLYVDGASEGTELTSQTITLDRAFEDGHYTYGGFPLAPTWTDDQDMSVLPSAAGWTYVGTATEANAFVVDGGILYQNGAGYASTNTGYYAKTTTLNNTTGWVVETKIKVRNSTNTVAFTPVTITVEDGAEKLILIIHEYFIEVYNAASVGNIQHDMTKVSNIKIIGKLSDFYIYIDNKLAFDGTGLNTNTTATNQIQFGDKTALAGENASAEWHYFKYYEGVHLPEYSSVQISEFAQWNDDKSSLLTTIYNAGSIQSVKALAGMNQNYTKAVKQAIEVRGITDSPTTTSTSPVPIDDLNGFVFGSRINALVTTTTSSTGTTQNIGIDIDGVSEAASYTYAYESSSTYKNSNTTPKIQEVYPALHYVNGGWFSGNGGLLTAVDTKRRVLTVEAK